MNTQRSKPYRKPGILPGLIIGIGCGLASATPGDMHPYQPDAHTLHLWHLDEAKAPFLNAVEGSLQLQGLIQGARAGMPTLANFGTSVAFRTLAGGKDGKARSGGAALLAAPRMYNDGRDNAPDDFRYSGVNGAFTLEALIKLDTAPSAMTDPYGGIITMDGEAENRVFNFRIERGGFLSFIPLNAQGFARGGGLAAIPTTGPHAVNTKDWFHVAAAYDGNEGVAGNLTLFWTRVDEPQDGAHVIGRGTLFEDLSRLSDFALGNEARGSEGQEPFPGSIDEVRISSVARDRRDFLILPPEKRVSPDSRNEGKTPGAPLAVGIFGMMVDGKQTTMFHRNKPSLSPGGHRLDFDFGVNGGDLHDAVRIRSRLRGFEEQWAESGRGMALTCEVLDARGDVISSIRRPLLGTSAGWRTDVEDSTMVPWSEPLHVPENGRSLRVVFSSGASDTVGSCVIDDLDVLRRLPNGKAQSLLDQVGFLQGDRTRLPHGTPSGWSRGGSAPAIARLVHPGDNPALALVDGDQAASGTWSFTKLLPKPPVGGEILVLQGKEMFNVIGGNNHRVTYSNLPAGDFTFEVVAITSSGALVCSHAELPFTVQARITSKSWFWALLAASMVGSLSIGVVAILRQKAARKLEKLRTSNAIAQDRARMARDMHDDLGTRVTLLTMNASLAEGELDKSPDKARQYLRKLNTASRNLVTAMNELVWAIDPKNDTLDRFGEHIPRLIDEIFRESEVRCTVDIPLVLPHRTLRSDFRNHLSLAVKEALHNILKHAGPCHASVKLTLAGDNLTILIEDDGRGFDPATPKPGNGLGNFTHRMAEIGGTCRIDSSPGKGTCTVLNCPLPADPSKTKTRK